MATTPAPGIYWGHYPERNDTTPARPSRPGAARYHRQSTQAQLLAVHWRALDSQGLASAVQDLRSRIARNGLDPTLSATALAAVSTAIERTLSLSVYPTQLFAAAVILDNRLAEMATGEGKTLVALLAAATGGLAGIPVHVLTANDYLVARDAQRLAPVYALLGLSVGAVTQDMDEEDRRAAYACDVTYVTAKELVFDYLRDGLRIGGKRSELARRAQALQRDAHPPLLRGLCMAVVDEADSLLIDEALTPLVLSRQQHDPAQHAFLWQAFSLSGQLQAETDFRAGTGEHAVLTDTGRTRIDALVAPLGGRWRSERMRDEAITLALAARHRFVRDRDYLVRDGKVEIIDPITGRSAPGRVWSRGLHTLIEIKEGCKPTPSTRTIAQITYQRFFPRYLRLGGMSGTLTEASGELREIYQLSVVQVPLRTPSRRQYLPTRLFPDQTALWTAVTARVQALRAQGRPVLIGTGSVSESEHLSAHLHAAGIDHQVLNARHDRDEAERVARAGQAGQVTVTTNMAGRGTDIPLAPAVVTAGGLHVLCCQHTASKRIDRQLQGRCARQGDPGSTETWLAMPDDLGQLPRTLLSPLTRLAKPRGPIQSHIAHAWLGWRQLHRARAQRLARRQLLQADLAWEKGLAFAGEGD